MSKSLKEVQDEINHIESHYNTENWKFYKLSLWPYLKVYFSTVNSSTSSLQKKIDKWSAFQSFIFSFLSSLDFNFYLKQGSALFFGVGKKYQTIDDKLVHLQFEPLKQKLIRHYDLLFVEFLFSNKAKRSASLGSDWIIYTIRIASYILSPILMPFFYINDFKPVSESLQSRGFSSTFLNRRPICELLLFLILAEKYYILLYKIIKPPFVIISCFYMRSNIAAISAAKKMNIKTVEYQHGVISQETVAYNNWTKEYSTIPDIFWVWSDSEAKVIKMWGGRTFIGGNLSLDFSPPPPHKAFFPTEKTKVLVSLQTGTDFKRLLDSLLSKLDDSHFLLIRLHPMMSKNEIKKVKTILKNRKTSDLKYSSSLPLSTIINICDVHLTLFSAVILEARQLGKKSIALSPDARDHFPECITDGSLHLYEHTEKLSKVIKKVIKNKKEKILDNIEDISELIDILNKH